VHKNSFQQMSCWRSGFCCSGGVNEEKKGERAGSVGSGVGWGTDGPGGQQTTILDLMKRWILGGEGSRRSNQDGPAGAGGGRGRRRKWPPSTERGRCNGEKGKLVRSKKPGKGEKRT